MKEDMITKVLKYLCIFTGIITFLAYFAAISGVSEVYWEDGDIKFIIREENE